MGLNSQITHNICGNVCQCTHMDVIRAGTTIILQPYFQSIAKLNEGKIHLYKTFQTGSTQTETVILTRKKHEINILVCEIKRAKQSKTVGIRKTQRTFSGIVPLLRFEYVINHNRNWGLRSFYIRHELLNSIYNWPRLLLENGQ